MGVTLFSTWDNPPEGGGLSLTRIPRGDDIIPDKGTASKGRIPLSQLDPWVGIQGRGCVLEWEPQVGISYRFEV